MIYIGFHKILRPKNVNIFTIHFLSNITILLLVLLINVIIIAFLYLLIEATENRDFRPPTYIVKLVVSYFLFSLIGLAYLFFTIIGAYTFAHEFERRTINFLLRLPVRRELILINKIIADFALIILYGAVVGILFLFLKESYGLEVEFWLRDIKHLLKHINLFFFFYSLGLLLGLIIRNSALAFLLTYIIFGTATYLTYRFGLFSSPTDFVFCFPLLLILAYILTKRLKEPY